jgi:hypothetical protein
VVDSGRSAYRSRREGREAAREALRVRLVALERRERGGAREHTPTRERKEGPGSQGSPLAHEGRDKRRREQESEKPHSVRETRLVRTGWRCEAEPHRPHRPRSRRHLTAVAGDGISGG